MVASKTRLLAKVAPFAEVLAAGGSPVRLAILYVLAHTEEEPRLLAEKLGISPTLTAHHLRDLYRTGWIKKSRYGKKVLYKLAKDPCAILTKLFHDTPADREFHP